MATFGKGEIVTALKKQTKKTQTSRKRWKLVACGMLPVFASGFWLWKGLGDAGVDGLFRPSFSATQFSSVVFPNSLFAKYASPAWQNGLLLVRGSVVIIICEESATVRAP